MPSTPGNHIRPLELDKSIEEVMHRREFAWRVPPDGADRCTTLKPAFSVQRHPLARKMAVDMRSSRPIGRAWTALRDWLHALKEKWLPPTTRTFALTPTPVNEGSGFNGGGPFLARHDLRADRRDRRPRAFRRPGKRGVAAGNRQELTGHAASPGAARRFRSEQRRECWQPSCPRMNGCNSPRRLREAGEHRLALRAFYLSILSLLGARGLLAVRPAQVQPRLPRRVAPPRP